MNADATVKAQIRHWLKNFIGGMCDIAVGAFLLIVSRNRLARSSDGRFVVFIEV
jgi:hypothetical protein